MLNRRETVETVADFILGGSKITVDHDCSHEIKRPWNERYDQSRKHIEKQRHYFVNKGLSIKAMIFPIVIYGCSS